MRQSRSGVSFVGGRGWRGRRIPRIFGRLGVELSGLPRGSPCRCGGSFSGVGGQPFEVGADALKDLLGDPGLEDYLVCWLGWVYLREFWIWSACLAASSPKTPRSRAPVINSDNFYWPSGFVLPVIVWALKEARSSVR